MASVDGCEMANATFVCPSTADRISRLYPAVNELETPLPRCWSTKDKSGLLGLSQNSLTVHYKGGKSPKDAASLRATYPIPSTCGIYYFEVTVLSKGRDGYMGIGLSASTVGLFKLPGLEKNSYGYHGENGNSFCCSVTGQPYGPTFTTGDVIGCCVNLIDNTCFYTKNGTCLGTVFTDLPRNLYPTIGLQTPGEIVEANFGQKEFVFNINNYFEEWRQKIKEQIFSISMPNQTGQWHQALNRVVSTYLVHHGYCETAKAFLTSTGQSCDEAVTSIQNRQKLQSLILSGRVGDAITMTDELYPGLLDQNIDLLFALKCRQFIEVVNGTDHESIPTDCMPPPQRRAYCSVASGSGGGCGSHSRPSSAASNPAVHSPHGCSPAPQQCSRSSSTTNGACISMATNGSAATALPINLSVNRNGTTLNGAESRLTLPPDCRVDSSAEAATDLDELDMDTSETDERTNAVAVAAVAVNGSNVGTEAGQQQHRVCLNGSSTHSAAFATAADRNTSSNNNTDCDEDDDDDDDENDDDLDDAVMEIDGSRTTSLHAVGSSVLEAPPGGSSGSELLCHGSEMAVRQLVQFARYLRQLSLQLVDESGQPLAEHQQTLRNAVSLLAYPDPWNSTVGYQLNPDQREAICMALNSAILDRQGLPKQPPLELALTHVNQCIKLMRKSGISSCAFAEMNQLLLDH